MAKLKSYGIITPEELHRTEQAGRFIITDKLTCAYCPKPLTVKDNQYLYCQQHQHLKVSVEAYPGYPAIPKEEPRYQQMHFSLSKLHQNRGRFDNAPRKEIARQKGCPFCDRYMQPPQADKHDFSVLNQSFFCPECGVDFQIVVIAEALGDQNVRALRFQPNAKHLPDEADGEHTDALDTPRPQIEQKVEQRIEQRIEQQTDAIEHTHPENRNNDTPDEVIETQVPKEVKHDTENREHSQVEHSQVEHKTIEHPQVEQDTVEHPQAEHSQVEHSQVEHSQIEWQTDDELAIAFIETHLIAEVEHFLPTPEIYHRYQTFAEKRNRTPLKDQKLYKHIRERFSVEKTRRRSNGKLQYGFIGIRCLKRNNETPDDRRS